MSQEIINIGAAPNDATGDSLRAGGGKINDNFTELYSNFITQVAVSDETTALTTGPAKLTMRWPRSFTLTAVRASLTTASDSGGQVLIDVNQDGSTIFSTRLSIDATEKTSTTAATPAVISTSAMLSDSEVVIDLDDAGSGAAGLKLTFYGTLV